MSSHPASSPHAHTPSLHDALPICFRRGSNRACVAHDRHGAELVLILREVGIAEKAQRVLVAGDALHQNIVVFACGVVDRKSTRLNSSHLVISYAVFCLKKKSVSRTLTPMKGRCFDERLGESYAVKQHEP